MKRWMKSGRLQYEAKRSSAMVIAWSNADAAGPQPVAYRLEIFGQIFSADGLDHLDRHDPVEDPADLPIVHQLELDLFLDQFIAARAPRRPLSWAGEMVRLVTRAPQDLAIAAASAPQPPPISQHAFPAAEFEPVDDSGEFRLLRLLQGRVGGREYRRRIGHRAVEPQTIELVAEIVMRDNVSLGSRGRVDVETMDQPIEKARRRRAF